LGQSIGQHYGFLALLHRHARALALCWNKRCQLDGRLLQRDAKPLDGNFASHIAPGGQYMLFDEARQIIHEYLSKPR